MPDEENLTVRSIRVIDENGDTRIRLEGGQAGSGGSIVFVTKMKKIFQIQEQPDGLVTMRFDGADSEGSAGLSGRGLWVSDSKEKPCVTIGTFEYEDHRGITIYKDGEPMVQIPL